MNGAASSKLWVFSPAFRMARFLSRSLRFFDFETTLGKSAAKQLAQGGGVDIGMASINYASINYAMLELLKMR
jgi:hypothetical protein